MKGSHLYPSEFKRKFCKEEKGNYYIYAIDAKDIPDYTKLSNDELEDCEGVHNADLVISTRYIVKNGFIIFNQVNKFSTKE